MHRYIFIGVMAIKGEDRQHAIGIFFSCFFLHSGPSEPNFLVLPVRTADPSIIITSSQANNLQFWTLKN